MKLGDPNKPVFLPCPIKTNTKKEGSDSDGDSPSYYLPRDCQHKRFQAKLLQLLFLLYFVFLLGNTEGTARKLDGIFQWSISFVKGCVPHQNYIFLF